MITHDSHDTCMTFIWRFFFAHRLSKVFKTTCHSSFWPARKQNSDKEKNVNERERKEKSKWRFSAVCGDSWKPSCRSNVLITVKHKTAVRSRLKEVFGVRRHHQLREQFFSNLAPVVQVWGHSHIQLITFQSSVVCTFHTEIPCNCK